MSIESILKKLRESHLRENQAKYLCKSIKVDNQGVMEIICYDREYDEEFEKYIGQVDSFDAQKNARLLLRDSYFEVPKDIKNELIGTFGLEEYGYKIEESEKWYTVIDNTQNSKAGDSEKYRVSTEKEAMEKVAYLVAHGSEEDKITIEPPIE